jgi:hypothetical protein
MIGGEVVVEPPSVVWDRRVADVDEIAGHERGQVDVEPPSVVELRPEGVNTVENDVVEVFFSGLFVVTRRCRLLLIYLMSSPSSYVRMR